MANDDSEDPIPRMAEHPLVCSGSTSARRQLELQLQSNAPHNTRTHTHPFSRFLTSRTMSHDGEVVMRRDCYEVVCEVKINASRKRGGARGASVDFAVKKFLKPSLK
jgi:hypothetical protein